MSKLQPWKDDWRSEEEILFDAAAHREPDPEPEGTTFAGTGPVCSRSLTINVQKGNRLREQKYW